MGKIQVHFNFRSPLSQNPIQHLVFLSSMTSMQQADALISASASMLTIQDAVLDSPIYRANIAHIEDQVDQIQLWLEGLTKQLRLYLDELNSKWADFSITSLQSF
jgi:hypothetical protein